MHIIAMEVNYSTHTHAGRRLCVLLFVKLKQLNNGKRTH